MHPFGRRGKWVPQGAFQRALASADSVGHAFCLCFARRCVIAPLRRIGNNCVVPWDTKLIVFTRFAGLGCKRVTFNGSGDSADWRRIGRGATG